MTAPTTVSQPRQPLKGRMAGWSYRRTFLKPLRPFTELSPHERERCLLAYRNLWDTYVRNLNRRWERSTPRDEDQARADLRHLTNVQNYICGEDLHYQRGIYL